MKEEELQKAQKPLVDTLSNLNAQVSTLALLGLANEFYSKDERAALYKEYESLLVEEVEMLRVVNRSRVNDGLGHEERIRKLGKEEADRVTAAFDKAMKDSQDLKNKIFRFKSKHSVIVDLFAKRGRSMSSLMEETQ